jgi:hypothetical protein
LKISKRPPESGLLSLFIKENYMKHTIETNVIHKGIELEANEHLAFGERRLPVDTHTVLQLSDEHASQLGTIALSGLHAFGAQEQTRAMELTGLPTLIARIDCTIDPETNDVHPYEVEERPAGMGITDQVMQSIGHTTFGKNILSHLENTLGELPVVKRHPNAKENDDGLLLPVETFTPTRLKIPGNRPILVRAEPEDMAAHPHIDAATAATIAPIAEKGKRQYRVTTGFADLITSPQTLPTNESFVLKTLQGSKAKGVKISLSKQDAAQMGNRDTVTRGKAVAFVQSEGGVLLERFVPGTPVRMNQAIMGHMILRIFALTNANTANVIGGAYMARPGHLVHGSNDAISGAVLPAAGEF